MIDYSPNDISTETAAGAFRMTSMDPDRRGRGIVRDYTSHMASVAAEFEAYATDQNRDEIAQALERYRQGYLRKLSAYLAAHSRTASTMVTGPANFPVARNQKRLETSDRRLEELLAYSNKVLAKLRSRYDPAEIARRPIRSTDDDAIAQLEEKIAEAQALQERMKAANRIVRRKKLADEEKVSQLVELGVPSPVARSILQPDYMNRVGYPDYALKNNNANIRRMQARIAEIRNLHSDDGIDEEHGDIKAYEDGGRVCIEFPGKPASATRDMLKRFGFKWAPSMGAWVRQATHNGREAARTVLNSWWASRHSATVPARGRPGRA